MGQERLQIKKEDSDLKAEGQTDDEFHGRQCIRARKAPQRYRK